MKIFLFFVVIALVWGGGQSLYTMLTSSKLQSFTIEEYLEQSPDDKWIEITGCTLDHSDAVWMESRFGDKIKEAYIPIYLPNDENEESNVKLLLAAKDPDTLDLVKQLSQLDSDEEALKYAIANLDKIIVKRDVKGMVRFGIEMDDKEAREIKEISHNLADDFVILDEGMKPDWHGVLMLPAGIALAYFLYFLKKKEPAILQTADTPPIS